MGAPSVAELFKAKEFPSEARVFRVLFQRPVASDLACSVVLHPSRTCQHMHQGRSNDRERRTLLEEYFLWKLACSGASTEPLRRT